MKKSWIIIIHSRKEIKNVNGLNKENKRKKKKTNKKRILKFQTLRAVRVTGPRSETRTNLIYLYIKKEMYSTKDEN